MKSIHLGNPRKNQPELNIYFGTHQVLHFYSPRSFLFGVSITTFWKQAHTLLKYPDWYKFFFNFSMGQPISGYWRWEPQIVFLGFFIQIFIR